MIRIGEFALFMDLFQNAFKHVFGDFLARIVAGEIVLPIERFVESCPDHTGVFRGIAGKPDVLVGVGRIVIPGDGDAVVSVRPGFSGDVDAVGLGYVDVQIVFSMTFCKA